jgi:serine/threonine protein kinase
MLDLKNNLNIINQGATSVSFTAPHLFVKYIVKYNNYDVYKREKYMSSILAQFAWYPKLLYSCDIENFFVFRYAGVPINLKNKPDDFKQQFQQILKDMKSVNIQHNDIKSGEILVHNKKIYLCDFGWASINNDIGCGIDIWSCKNTSKPGGYFDDNKALNRIKLV